MKKLFILLALLMFYVVNASANGVAIVDSEEGIYLNLESSEIEVEIENQVAVVTSKQVFHNDFNWGYFVKYGFPVPEEASATQLRWFIEGEWFYAELSPTPQDSAGPGGDDLNEQLVEYLGETPLFFEIPQGIEEDSLITVEITYVQLLPYEFGNVNFTYPNDYHLIQTEAIDSQQMHLMLNSQRTIEAIQLLSHSPTLLINNGYSAELGTEIFESSADADYRVEYSLSLDELGLWGMSTQIDPEDVPDELGNGYFTFIAEPDPSENAVINKVFTLMVDRSGSMYGEKMAQAIDAAEFITQNLNEGDMFNIVDFSSSVSSFQPEHVEYLPENEEAALNYIAGFIASGSTNISGAFDVAIPQFGAANDSTANIIIFFTDGQPTVGITQTEPLVEHINQLVAQTETNVMINTFGIGDNVNTQLLTLLATDNSGFAEFLGDDEVEEIITDFYLMIRNPVLLDTEIAFSPDGIVQEVYPDPLPNLYQGTQMIVSGRYIEPVPVTVSLSGNAFGQPVEYEYQLALVDSADAQYQFLTKLWAKSKIEHLLVTYYTLEEDSEEAQEVKQQIIDVSLAYGVLSPFTSFTESAIDDEYDFSEIDPDDPASPVRPDYQLMGNYPNPFNPTTTIQFRINRDIDRDVQIKIFNSAGQLVKTYSVFVEAPGIYSVVWDGLSEDGEFASSGMYFYIIDFGDAVLSDRMILLK